MLIASEFEGEIDASLFVKMLKALKEEPMRNESSRQRHYRVRKQVRRSLAVHDMEFFQHG